MAARKKTGAGAAAKAKKLTQAAREKQHAEVMEKARQIQAKELVAAAPHRKATVTESASATASASLGTVKVTKGRRGRKPHKFQRRDRDDSQQVSATMPRDLVDTLRSICEQRKESVTRPFVQRDVIELALTEWCHRAVKRLGGDELQNALTADELAERIASLKR